MYEKPEQKKMGLTRREFLRGTATTTGTVLLIPNILNIAFLNRAEAVAVKEGMSWEEGLAAFKDDVFNAPTETAAIYTEGALSGWRRVRDLGITNGTDADTVSDDVFFENIIANEKELRLARRAHVHTISGLIHIKSVPENVKELLKRGEISPPLSPPSMADIILHIWTHKRRFEKTHIVFEDIALDPTGMWRMSLAESGTFAKTIFEYATLRREKIPRAIEQSDLSPDNKEKLSTCVKNLDTSCVKGFNIDEVSRLFDRFYSMSVSAGMWFGRADVYQNMVHNLQSGSVSLPEPERDEHVKSLQQMAREIDIKLTFEPYGKNKKG